MPQMFILTMNFSFQIKSRIKWYWNHLSSGEKVFVPICALNLLVFGLWRVQRIQPFMLKYFCSNPVASKSNLFLNVPVRNLHNIRPFIFVEAVCWPMLLSTFSHYSAFHIFANMYVLHSFANVAVASLGKEQFLYLFLCGGKDIDLLTYQIHYFTTSIYNSIQV